MRSTVYSAAVLLAFATTVTVAMAEEPLVAPAPLAPPVSGDVTLAPSAEAEATASPATLTSGAQSVTAPQQIAQDDAPPTAEEYWTIAARTTKLNDYSSGKYKAMAITLTNTTPVHVELMNGEVMNALNEQQLAQEKAESKSRNRGFRNLGLGLAGAATSFVPGVGGWAAHSAVNTASAVNHQVNQFDSNNVMPSGQYVQRVNQMVLSPNQSVTFNVVLPKSQSPNLRMVFKNLVTNQILDLNRPIQ